jgi:hypothetical protein
LSASQRFVAQPTQDAYLASIEPRDDKVEGGDFF